VQAQVIDYNRDQKFDIFIVNNEGPSFFYRNLGNLKFKKDSPKGIKVATKGIAAAFDDYDQDGDDDLVMAQKNGADTAESLRALHIAIGKKDWVEAQRLAQKIRALDPQNAELSKLPAAMDVGLALLAFYSGQYQQSADLLERLAAKKKDSAKVFFYLACSNAALAFEQIKQGNGAMRKKQLLEKARQEFAEAQRIDPLLQYDRKYICTRILQIYESIRR